MAIFIFFIVIYAFKGYLNPFNYDFVSESFTNSTLGTSSDSFSTSTDKNLSFPEKIVSSILTDVSNLNSKGIYTPNRDHLPPVVGESNIDTKDGKLTDDGVFFGTNEERLRQSLPSLRRNSVLDKSAEVKLNDMFTNQYFEHVSPNGSSVSDVVNAVGYKFLIIGENLALGNFAGDTKVVSAWMASPGHRENILDKRYTEIGIAVGYGMYKGRMQWLAVQHFARPISSCPSPNAGLKDRISKDKEELALRESDITSMKKTVDVTESSALNFESTISSYNALVNDYNNKLKNLKTEISNYNSQVNNFNSCLDAVTTSVQ